MSIEKEIRDYEALNADTAMQLNKAQQRIAELKKWNQGLNSVNEKLLDRAKRAEAQLAEKTKEFDSLLKRDTSNLKRLIEAQAQLAETKQYLFHTPDCDMSIAHNLMGTSPNGCNCGLIELQAILK